MRLATFLSLALVSSVLPAQDLPVDLKRLEEGVRVTDPLDKVFRYQTILAHLTEDELHGAVSGDKQGLLIDFSKIKKLADGRALDAQKLSGEISWGAYPFAPSEMAFGEKYFQESANVKDGKVTVSLENIMSPMGNVNKWKDKGSIVIRFQLFYGNAPLGVPDIYCAFEKTADGFQKLPWLTEFPTVNSLTSDTPSRAMIRFRTDTPVKATLRIIGLKDIAEESPATDHKTQVDGLAPDKEYQYQLLIGKMITPLWKFKSAPEKSKENIRFAVAGDSGSDYGAGMQNYMGCNYEARQSLLKVISKRDCSFLLTLGDLCRGYSIDKTDFIGQLRAAKDSLSPYWRNCPVYTLAGNHELLCSVFYFPKLQKENFVQIDKWPYSSDSGEAVIAAEFNNPANAPSPSDKRRPPYTGTVYSFVYGPVKVIVMNNNYWFSRYPETYGGAPYGVILDDQMDWLDSEISKADDDSTVKYIFAAMHCPPFPAGSESHMWRFGDNTVKAYTFENGKLTPQKAGLIEQRNKLAAILSRSPKVAAVFSGHEHNYSRRLIDKTVPAGNLFIDDDNCDGVINSEKEKPSTLPELVYPVWYIISGGSGSRPCAGQDSPWDNHWREKNPANFKFSIQRHFLELETSKDKVSLKVFNDSGTLIDEIPDLTSVKRGENK